MCTLNSILRVTNLKGKTSNLNVLCLSLKFKCHINFGLNHGSFKEPPHSTLE